MSQSGSADLSPLGERLLLARKQAGLTTREVAEKLAPKLAISHATVANYEKGRSVPTLDVLLQLAGLYDRDLTWFTTTARKLTGVQFRKVASRVKVSEEEAYKAAAQRWLEAYIRLEQHVGAPPRTDWREGIKEWPKTTGEALATHVRRDLLRLDDHAPIPSVIEVIEDQFGIRVLELPTAARIDGLAAMYGEDPVIVLNPTTAHDRARLNAAHELGHILFGDCHEDATRQKHSEDRGYEFAVNLLLPRPALKDAFHGQSMVKLVRFKELYGISLAAMVYRAGKLGILPKKQETQLWIEFAKRGWRQKEPGLVRADRAIRFERLYEEALADQKLTPAQVPQVLGVREDEMRLRLQTATGLAPEQEDHADEMDANEDGGDEPRTIPFPR